MDLKGRVAVVTGGGSGQDAETSRRLVRAGAVIRPNGVPRMQ